MIQLIQPNLNTVGQVGYCLKYARQVFGISAVYATAWQAWQATKYKHTDRNLPNVSVLCWFSYQTAGHVVVYVPNKGFYSSPYRSTQSYYVGSSIADIEAKYACSYVGWSEDVNNVRVAQGGDEMPITDADNEYGRWNKLFTQIRGRSATREEFRNAAVGRQWLTAMEILSDDSEADQATNDGYLGARARAEKWETQLTTLQNKVNQISAQLTGLTQTVNEKQAEIASLQDQVADLTKENTELKAQIATSGGDTELLNSFGQLLRKLIERLGIK